MATCSVTLTRRLRIRYVQSCLARNRIATKLIASGNRLIRAGGALSIFSEREGYLDSAREAYVRHAQAAGATLSYYIFDSMLRPSHAGYRHI